MTVFAIAQLTIHDRTAYDRYQARFMEVFRHHRGRLLAADEQPRTIEGTWPHQKLVLMSFPDEAAFHDWRNRTSTNALPRIARQAHAPWYCWFRGSL